jgi:hypothetical protein
MLGMKWTQRKRLVNRARADVSFVLLTPGSAA